MSTPHFSFNHTVSPHLENPYPLYAQARKEAPIFFNPMFNAWFVTRYDDVIAILRDPQRFSSKFIFRMPSDPSPAVQDLLDQLPPEVPLLVTEDPPGHTRTRALVSKAFSTKRIAAIEPLVRKIANALIDTFIAEGQADLVRQYTQPLPLQVLLEFIGLPVEDAAFIKQWTLDRLLLTSLPGVDPEEQLRAARMEADFIRYAQQIIAERQRNPQDDLLSGLINAEVEGERSFDDVELINLLQQLLFAGHETTTNLLSNTFYQLLTHPEHWQHTQTHPELIANVVEEGLRHDSPVQAMLRTTTETVELGGVTIPAGDRVFICFGAANRDEGTFHDAERFDFERANAHKHLSLGYGIHYCIGAPLARLEARVAIEVLAQRIPQLRLAPHHRASYIPSLLHRILQELPVIWE